MNYSERTQMGPARKHYYLAIAAVLLLGVDVFADTVKAKSATVEDNSPRFLIKEIRISGNTLMSTEELLTNMPLTYMASDSDGSSGEKKAYDFTVLYDIILEPGEPREVTEDLIQGFTRYILSRYLEKRYAGIYVYVKAKSVKGVAQLKEMVLPIQVLEGRVSQIETNRYDFDRRETNKQVLKSSVLESWMPTKKGQVISKKKLDDFIRLLNLNPDRYVTAVISTGDEPNTLNVSYDVYETNPWHFFTQIDSAGTNKRRWRPRFGVINTNLTGRDDKLSFIYQITPDQCEKNYSIFGSYETPVFTPRLRLGVFAGYSEFEVTPDTGADINFRGNGSFYGGTLRYNVTQIGDWFVDFVGTLSHEKSKFTPSLGTPVDIDMDLFGCGAELYRSGNKSSTSFSFNRLESIDASGKSRFTTARLKSDPDFTIYTFSANHKRFLDVDKIHELSGFFRGIASNERLIPAKMTTFGGLYTVRGYKEDEIVADGGMLFSAQYRFDLTRYLEKDGVGSQENLSEYEKSKKMWPPRVSLLGFIDNARAKIKDHVPGENGVQELCSLGLGTTVDLGRSAHAAIYFAWPLRSTDETNNGEGRWNFSFIYRW